MKNKDYNQSIDVLDAEATSIIERLDGLDPTTEEYKVAADNLKTLQEAKQIEVRNKSENLAGKIPAWGTALISSIVGVGTALTFGWKVLTEERGDGVVSSQAVNVFDKVIRKF